MASHLDTQQQHLTHYANNSALYGHHSHQHYQHQQQQQQNYHEQYQQQHQILLQHHQQHSNQFAGQTDNLLTSVASQHQQQHQSPSAMTAAQLADYHQLQASAGAVSQQQQAAQLADYHQLQATAELQANQYGGQTHHLSHNNNNNHHHHHLHQHQLESLENQSNCRQEHDIELEDYDSNLSNDDSGSQGKKRGK